MTEEISAVDSTEAAPADAVVDASVEPKEPGEEDAKAEEKPPEPPKEKVSVSFRQRLEFEKRRVALERERNAEKARADKAHAALAKLKENPFEGLKEAGTSYEEITRRALEDPKSAVELELAELRATVQELREARAREREQVEHEAALKREESAKNDVFGFFKSNEDAYPTLASYRPEIVREAAWNLIAEYYSKVQDLPDNAEVFDLLEQKAAEEERYREEQKAARLAKKAPPPLAKTNGAPKTLSHAQTGEKAFFPPDMDKLPEEEQQRLRIEYLRQHMRQRAD